MLHHPLAVGVEGDVVVHFLELTLGAQGAEEGLLKDVAVTGLQGVGSGGTSVTRSFFRNKKTR